MDALELRQQLIESMVVGLKTMAKERAETNGGFRYAELVGRMDTMRTTIEFLQSADIGPCANCPKDSAAKQGPRKGCEQCGGECQGHPDSGDKPKRSRKGKA